MSHVKIIKIICCCLAYIQCSAKKGDFVLVFYAFVFFVCVLLFGTTHKWISLMQLYPAQVCYYASLHSLVPRVHGWMQRVLFELSRFHASTLLQ